jgi:hypothetical protein
MESRLLLRQVAMVILPFSLGIGRAELFFFRRYAMTTSTALYLGREDDGHGHTPFPLRTRRPDLLFYRRYAMTT